MRRGVRQHHGDAYPRTPNRLKLGAWLSGCSHGKVRVQHSHICSFPAAKPRETKEEMTSTRSLEKVATTQGSSLLVPHTPPRPSLTHHRMRGFRQHICFPFLFLFTYLLPLLCALNRGSAFHMIPTLANLRPPRCGGWSTSLEDESP